MLKNRHVTQQYRGLLLIKCLFLCAEKKPEKNFQDEKMQALTGLQGTTINNILIIRFIT